MITTIISLEFTILFKFSLQPLFSVKFHWISSIFCILDIEVNRTVGYVCWLFTGILLGFSVSPAAFFPPYSWEFPA